MNRRRMARLGLLVAGAVGVGLMARAGTAEASDRFVDPHYYGDYDLNEDGVIDHFERDVMHYDHDNDGRLDPAERAQLDRHLDQMLGARGFADPVYRPYYDGLRRRYVGPGYGGYPGYHPLDRDGDGVIERWERRRTYRLYRPARVHPLDLDRDGVIERWERREARQGPTWGGTFYLRW